MKTIQDFITFTNLSKNRVKLSATLIIAALVYALMYALLNTIVFVADSLYYYAALYVFVIWTAYIFMIILFQFVQRKRDMHEKLKLKQYILPLWGVQTILFIVMIGSGLMAFMASGNSDMAALYYILTPICILLVMIYIPLQIFAFIAIYDGMRNPFAILFQAVKKLTAHYRTCFYALAVLLLVAMLYQVIMSTFFNVSASFEAARDVQNIMVASNPFLHAIDYTIYAFQNAALWPAAVVSFLYGIIMCILLVYYYMVMLSAYDEDIKV